MECEVKAYWFVRNWNCSLTFAHVLWKYVWGYKFLLKFVRLGTWWKFSLFSLKRKNGILLTRVKYFFWCYCSWATYFLCLDLFGWQGWLTKWRLLHWMFVECVNWRERTWQNNDIFWWQYFLLSQKTIKRETVIKTEQFHVYIPKNHIIS